MILLNYKNTSIKSIRKWISSINYQVMTFIFMALFTISDAFASKPDINKLPDFKMEGIDGSEKDPVGMTHTIVGGIVTIVAILLAAGTILTVAYVLMKIYQEIQAENSKKNWGHFLIAFVVGFVLIFITLYLVKLAASMF
ncbi:DUF2976 domain-containing protein [Phocoenobacter skyensis]|uniref:DUF2976 domain-containing protein n=1 Tax=Phocoenobacter skyensis TaxID=97481 RepID=UPI00274755AF|nr:DUF2976 domain-containing protein [Pasteurella skyensis]MDP8185317.1 DUF2976 domain-containing protein [Pasteurella skyensis]